MESSSFPIRQYASSNRLSSNKWIVKFLKPILNKLSQMSPGWFRLFLAMVVVLFHTSKFVFFGFWAVFVFFILSGYWIAEMYREKYSALERPIVAFELSRLMRIFPTFLACAILAACVIASGYGGLSPKLVQDPVWLARSIVMLGSSSSIPRLIETQWSLDIEIQFYLFFPLMYGTIKYLSPARIVGCIAFLGLLSLLLGWSNSLLVYLPFFVVGVTISELKWSSSEWLLQTSILIAATVFVGLLLNAESRNSILTSGRVEMLGHNMTRFIDVLFAILAIPFVSVNVRIKDNKLGAHAGNLSYPLYLVHWIVLGPYVSLYGHLAMRDRLPYFVVYLAVSLVVTLLIYLLVDRPFDAWRRASVRAVCSTQVSTTK